MSSGGSASVAFSVVALLNLALLVATKVIGNQNAKKVKILKTLSHAATFCIVLLGCIVVVMVSISLIYSLFYLKYYFFIFYSFLKIIVLVTIFVLAIFLNVKKP
jgi:hypothetical protein